MIIKYLFDFSILHINTFIHCPVITLSKETLDIFLSYLNVKISYSIKLLKHLIDLEKNDITSLSLTVIDTRIEQTSLTKLITIVLKPTF